MDFFERQDRARRCSAVLVLVFLVAVAGIVTAALAVVWAALGWYLGEDFPAFTVWLTQPTALWVAAVIVAVIAFGSIRRWRQLAEGGGDRIAMLLGGRKVDPDTRDAQEKVLINVVEETAIAAGLTVPNVYVLDRESGLNAFAAGTDPANSVIAVTQGMLDALDRDELQGVVAHEMSHVLNSDTRLNMHLLAMLAGITMVGALGTWMLAGMFVGHGTHHSSWGWSAGSRDRHGFGALPVVLVAGLALIVLGWLGVLVARLIKAAVSRHREHLADAASVQLTRNPDGLGGALLQIDGARGGSMLSDSHAEEISHMGFGRTVGGLSRLTATHPSIEERMAALGPKYKYWYRQARRERARAERASGGSQRAGTSAAAAGASGGGGAGGGGAAGVAGAATAVPSADQAADLLTIAAVGALAGELGRQGMAHARQLLQRIPEEVRETVHTPEGAARVVYALMMHGPEHRDADLGAIPEIHRDAVTALRAGLEAGCGGDERGTLDPSARLAVLELALPALPKLEDAGKRHLMEVVDALIRANGRISVFEFAARTLLEHRLYGRPHRNVSTGRLEHRPAELRVVLSLLAHAAGGDDAVREAAYARGFEAAGVQAPGELLALDECSLGPFSQALERLAEGLQPRAKRALIYACGACIAADGRIRPQEAELLRVIGSALEIPIPPLPSRE